MSDYKVTGSCLCGEVSYQITGNLGIFQYCNCSRCRKFTGSAFAANILVAPEHFQWNSGEEQVGVYNLPDTRHFATAFCQNCGSSMPWRAQSGRAVIIPAGSLNEDPEIRPMHNIYCASRAEWYTDPASIKEFAELPVKS
ncbi:MAG: GFA family protein [Neptuniibacter sp.]